MSKNHLQLLSDNSVFIIQHIMDYLFHDESNPSYWDETTGTWGDMQSATRYSRSEKMAKSMRTKTGETIPNVKGGEWVDLFDIEKAKSNHPTAYIKKPTLKAVRADLDQ